MTLLLIVPESDAPSVAAYSPPVDIAVISGTAPGFAIRLPDGSSLAPGELATRAIGGAATTAAGLAALGRALDGLAKTAGTDALPLCDLSGADMAEASLLRFVADAMTVGARRQAQRIVMLNRDIVALRQTHEQTQTAFARLESFVYQHALAARREILSLPPADDLPSIRIDHGATLVQRLPVASDGLCDIVLHADVAGGDGAGLMVVTLTTREDATRRAEWVVREADLPDGPLRLSLHTALEVAALIPVVEVTWNGEGSLGLAASLRNPDPRFRAHLGGQVDARVLAVGCWSYLPGCDVPVAAGAVLPTRPDERPVRQKLIDATLLATVEDLTPASQYSRFIPEEGIVVVHPMEDGESVMRLAAALSAGAIHVVAEVSSGSESAADIEYALGMAPAATLSDVAGPASQSAPAVMSGWVRLSALEVGEVHLPIPAPLDEAHDLFLMTRLAERPGNPAFAWARFNRIRMTIG